MRVCLGLLLCAVTSTGCVGALPTTTAPQREPLGPEQIAIEKQSICVGTAGVSVGELAEELYYRAVIMPDGTLSVGYFAFFSDERPWGNNWQTWTVLPALFIDMFYSRLMFVGPGVQRAISGKGDVEGFRIDYQLGADGTLKVQGAEADDASHQPVQLTAAEVMSMDAKRPTLYSRVWSHQLGGRGLRSLSELSYCRCYGPSHIRALTDEIAAEFRVEGRATPAHVEALGGMSVDSSRLSEVAHRAVARPLVE